MLRTDTLYHRPRLVQEQCNDTTPVYVWNDTKRMFVATPAGKVVCPECGYKTETYWDGNPPSEPWLVCMECGEQFSTEPD